MNGSKYFDRLILLGVLLFTIFIQWWHPNWLNRVDGIAYDQKLRLLTSPNSSPSANIQIVDIDEQSLKSIGRWPWSRRHIAQLVEQLTTQGAVVIAFDVLFTEPHENPVSRMQNYVTNPNNIEWSKLSEVFDEDKMLAHALASNETVLGTLFLQQADIANGKLQAPNVRQNSPNSNTEVHTFSGANGNLERLANVANGQGFINAILDQDGFIRKAALLVSYKDTIYPSLALEAYRLYTLADEIHPNWYQSTTKSWLTGVTIGTSYFTTDEKGQVLIPYRNASRAYPYTSAAEVINSNITDNRFTNAVVFIGSSAVGIADLKTTPVSLAHPGVEIHAAIFDALMSPERFITMPDWWLGAMVLEFLLLTLVIATSLHRLPPVLMILSSFTIILLTIATKFWLWSQFNLHLPMVSSILLIFIASAYVIGKSFYQENIKRQRVKAIFNQYVPPAHIDEILASSDAQSIDGERKELSVLFADIRSFTTISEQLPANELKQLLNTYFSPMTESIFDHQGTIDKYVGDMVMAFWGAPLPDERHAEHAIDAAFAMLDAVNKSNSSQQNKNWPTIEIGIGINTGDMNVGDMGSDFRRSYTVIGDAVNLGSRIEGLTKYYQLPLLVSEFTMQQSNNYRFQAIDKVQVKGKSQPVTLYLPLAKKASKSETERCDAFNQIFDHYLAQEFTVALSQLENLIAQYGKCRLYSIYQQRLTNFISYPPDEFWDGIYTHNIK